MRLYAVMVTRVYSDDEFVEFSQDPVGLTRANEICQEYKTHRLSDFNPDHVCYQNDDGTLVTTITYLSG